MKKILVWGLILCLMAGSMATGAWAAPSLSRINQAFVMVMFRFDGEYEQGTLGMVVGEAGQPSRYVMLDDYYYTDDEGYEAKDVLVYSMQDYTEYAVKGIRQMQDSRLIVLETETEIAGSAAMGLAPAEDYAIGKTVYPVQMVLSGDDAGRCVMLHGAVQDFAPRGTWYEEPMLQIQVEEKDVSAGGLNIVLGESGGVAAFNYDYDSDAGMQTAFAAETMAQVLDTYGIAWSAYEAQSDGKSQAFGSLMDKVRQNTETDPTEEPTEEEPAAEPAQEPAAENVPAEDSEIVWADARFGQLVEEAMGKVPTMEEMAQVQTLILMGESMTIDKEAPSAMSQGEPGSVSCLDDLAYFTGLKTLWVIHQPVSDISGVAACKDLEYVCLCYNMISDLTPLSGLTGISELYLYDNMISDVSPLAGLTNMESLGLGYNGISDISPLAGMTKLTFLRIHQNNISDLSVLSGLYQLDDLVITGNMVFDLKPIAGLTRLKLLRASDNMIMDISPLAGLVRLEELLLEDNAITDISPLTGLVKLKKLDIEGNPVTDVSGLEFVEEFYHD